LVPALGSTGSAADRSALFARFSAYAGWRIMPNGLGADFKTDYSNGSGQDVDESALLESSNSAEGAMQAHLVTGTLMPCSIKRLTICGTLVELAC
jgi:hypothetical protein